MGVIGLMTRTRNGMMNQDHEVPIRACYVEGVRHSELTANLFISHVSILHHSVIIRSVLAHCI